MQAAVTTATAARFGLRVGAHLAMGPQVQLVITGIIRPLTRRPTSGLTIPRRPGRS